MIGDKNKEERNKKEVKKMKQGWKYLLECSFEVSS